MYKYSRSQEEYPVCTDIVRIDPGSVGQESVLFELDIDLIITFLVTWVTYVIDLYVVGV